MSNALLEIDAEAFRESFNRRAFPVRHRLAGHPLFALDRLIELAGRLPEPSARYNGGDIPVETPLYEGPSTGLSLPTRSGTSCHGYRPERCVTSKRKRPVAPRRAVSTLTRSSRPIVWTRHMPTITSHAFGRRRAARSMRAPES